MKTQSLKISLSILIISFLIFLTENSNAQNNQNPNTFNYQPQHPTHHQAKQQARVLRKQGRLDISEGRELKKEAHHAHGTERKVLRHEGKVDIQQGRVLKAKAKELKHKH